MKVPRRRRRRRSRRRHVSWMFANAACSWRDLTVDEDEIRRGSATGTLSPPCGPSCNSRRDITIDREQRSLHADVSNDAPEAMAAANRKSGWIEKEQIRQLSFPPTTKALVRRWAQRRLIASPSVEQHSSKEGTVLTGESDPGARVMQRSSSGGSRLASGACFKGRVLARACASLQGVVEAECEFDSPTYCTGRGSQRRNREFRCRFGATQIT